METPDTKDCEKESNLIEHNGNYYVRCETHEEIIRRLQEKHEEALLSRDAYWMERVRKETESKDGAYHERDMLVCALSKLFPSYLARHREEDTEWENDWRWIVYIEIPTKVKVVSGDQHNHILESKWFETKIEQISWHIHDSEREMFNHLEVKENNWDGHNTERKYQRLQALDTLLDNLK